MYQEMLDGNASSDSAKDIYRKMAALFTQVNKFNEAAESLKAVIKEEKQELLKVGLLTKMAGNYKKANMASECIDTSKEAYELMKRLTSETDPQTCRTKINLGQVYQHFEMNDEAKALYQEYLDMFAEHSSEGGAAVDAVLDWSNVQAYTKLRDFAMVAIDEIDGGDDEEEYYDEEDDGEKK